MTTTAADRADQLVEACRVGDEKAVTAMLAAGVDIFVPSRDGFLPLYMAAMKGKDAVVKLLIARGGVGGTSLAIVVAKAAMPGAPVPTPAASTPPVDLKGSDNETALYIAVRNHFKTIVETLLQAGANINEVNGKNRETVLHCACRMGLLDIVELLLSKALPSTAAASATAANATMNASLSSININSRTLAMETPLFMASKYGRTEVVYRLLLVDANKTITNDEGKNAVFVASENDHAGCVKLLLCEDKKFLRDVKTEVDYEERQKPTPMADVGKRLASAGTQRKSAEEHDTHVVAPKVAKASTAATSHAATGSHGTKHGHAHAHTSAAMAPAPAPTPVLVEMTKFVPIDIPKGPDNSAHTRTVDPLTGKVLPPCRTMMEAGHFERPEPPAKLMKPVNAPKPQGTVLIGADGKPIVIPDPV